MKVSVIVPFREENKMVDKCIASLLEQTYKNKEIVTISEKQTTFKNALIKKVLVKPCGPGKKRNAGAEIAKGNIFLFIDSDCILEKRGIEKLVKLIKEKKVDAISGTISPPRDSGVLNFLIQSEYEQRFLEMGEGYTNVLATTCCAVKRKAFESIEGFREISTRVAIGEDWDFSARLKEKNFIFWHTNQVKVLHYSAPKLLKYLKEQYLHARYRVFHFLKYPQHKDDYIKSNKLLLQILLYPLTILITARRICIKSGRYSSYLLIPISLIRGVFWLVGAVAGYTKGWEGK